LLDHAINSFQPLMMRVEKEKIEAMLAQNKEALSSGGAMPGMEVK
jgi:methionyl-tRNA synthetase